MPDNDPTTESEGFRAYKAGLAVGRENVQRGRRNRTAGKRWQQDCAAWLREHGWPGAEYQIRNHSSDLTGTWDLAVETTITTWDKLWIKLGQAMSDAETRGLSDFCVWKKRNGASDPGMGAVVMRAQEFFPLMQRLEKLEARAIEEDDQLARGFRMGVDFARRQAAAEEAV